MFNLRNKLSTSSVAQTSPQLIELTNVDVQQVSGGTISEVFSQVKEICDASNWYCSNGGCVFSGGPITVNGK